MKVDLFIPCFIDQLYPETAFSVVRILEHLNIEVNYNPKQTCCGQLAFNGGYLEEARSVSEKFLKDIPGEIPVVCPSASCAGFIKRHYPVLFKDTPFYEKAVRLADNMFELTDFLVNKLKVTDLNSYFPHKVTYHSACTALREYGIFDEPLSLLKKVKGLELLELNDSDTCCGFGGTFSVKHEGISSAMVQQKVENALNTGAEFITSTEASCLMNIEGYIKKHNLKIKTIHIAEILGKF